MSSKYAYTKKLKAVFLALMTTLLLAGCMSEDDKRVSVDKDKVGSGEVFHGAEWATIKNLDPRKEECADCHGKNNDMSPYNSGVMAHNIGLQKNTDHSAYADLKITKVIVDEDSGEVTVTLNKPLPSGTGALSMTFAKLAPRVIHNRGHDWQNYFSSNALGRGGNEPKASFMPNGGVAPQTVPSPVVNGKTITFNLNSGEGRSFGKHSFTVKSAYESDTDVWNYEGILGTKMDMGEDLATHVYCDEAHANSNQTADSTGAKSVCWWPDGTHLTAGTFVTTDNEFVVEYNPDQTHRVTIILGSSAGNPGFNTWYDFVPSVANGKDPADIKVTVGTNTVITAASYVKANGEVNALAYDFNDGRGVVGSDSSSNATKDADSGVFQFLPAARDIVDVQSCNSCHDSLTMHGGSGRSQTQTCVTCHNPGNLQASSGRSVDFKQLIHRLHRGANLPSEAPELASLMDDKSLRVETATDFTKVRFPQGPTPGSAAGITNCVKCHMGEQTQNMVQDLADSLGAADFNVASKMKLAKVTPQGDNWLAVRSVNACQACHDSNIWFADGLAGFGGNGSGGVNEHRNPNAISSVDPVNEGKLDKYIPYYDEAYSGVGYKWLGKKLTRTAEEGAIHNAAVAGNNGRFTCGSGGGCHGNNAIDTLNPMNVGDRNTNAIQQVHLELTRNHILAERFAIEISEPKVTAAGVFTADVQVIDKKTGSHVVQDENAAVTVTDLALITKASLAVRIGWMHDNSPDYNHSPNNGSGPFQTIPGAPFQGTVEWESNGKGTLVGQLSAESRSAEWEKLKNNLDNVKFTVFVSGQLQGETTSDPRYNLTAANLDFKANGDLLVDGEGRRKVVDFNAGKGIDEGRDRYAGWDKEHGANTQSCSSCHLQLTYHGSITNNVQTCVTCHNAQRTDLRARAGELGVDGQYEESLDFKRLIHAIHSAPNKRIDPMYVGLNGNARPSIDKEGDVLANTVRGNSFPGVISNCKSCHIQDVNSGLWTFDLKQLPEGMIGSTAITGDWANEAYDPRGSQHDFANHMKMSPIASVCSSCHDAGYKTTDGRMNSDILDGGPYVGSHWWQMGGIAPGIVRPGESPQSTKHQSGK